MTTQTWTNWQTKQMYTRVMSLLEQGASSGPWSAETLRGLVTLPLAGTNWEEVASEVNLTLGAGL